MEELGATRCLGSPGSSLPGRAGGHAVPAGVREAARDGRGTSARLQGLFICRALSQPGARGGDSAREVTQAKCPQGKMVFRGCSSYSFKKGKCSRALSGASNKQDADFPSRKHLGLGRWGFALKTCRVLRTRNWPLGACRSPPPQATWCLWPSTLPL